MKKFQILLLFLSFTIICHAQTYYRYVPRTTPPPDYGQISRGFSNDISAIAAQRQAERDRLDNSFYQSQSEIQNNGSYCYYPALNDLISLIKTAGNKELEYYHSQLLNGVINPSLYESMNRNVVSETNRIVNQIGYLDGRLNQHPAGGSIYNLVNIKLNSIVRALTVNMTNQRVTQGRYTSFSSQTINFSNYGTPTTLSSIISNIESTVNSY